MRINLAMLESISLQIFFRYYLCNSNHTNIWLQFGIVASNLEKGIRFFLSQLKVPKGQ